MQQTNNITVVINGRSFALRDGTTMTASGLNRILPVKCIPYQLKKENGRKSNDLAYYRVTGVLAYSILVPLPLHTAMRGTVGRFFMDRGIVNTADLDKHMTALTGDSREPATEKGMFLGEFLAAGQGTLDRSFVDENYLNATKKDNKQQLESFFKGTRIYYGKISSDQVSLARKAIWKTISKVVDDHRSSPSSQMVTYSEYTDFCKRWEDGGQSAATLSTIQEAINKIKVGTYEEN